ncbi:serine/threonine protein kinase [Gordonia zhaorongruii]|uniref:serine/threonine protein kinase n=1 Tax=Gordonia zhaorongruii TaxID=2597659 RepID=UPI00104FA4FF|nr:serine/threonine protein kinase [Gordonia zhaorongruii]
MTTPPITSLRAWPAATLAAWSAARGARRCAPDDVLHTLHDFAQAHEIDVAPSAADVRISGNTVLGLLDLLAGNAHLAMRMPAPGDAQGLPPGRVAEAAMSTDEVLLIDDRPAGSSGPTEALALIPRGTPERCRWTLIRSDAPIGVDHLSADTPLGEVEYELRGAVAEAADTISSIAGARPPSPADLRDALAGMTQARRIDLPPHDNPRVDRVLAAAAQVDAIVALAGSGRIGVAGSEIGMADDRFRRLSALTRTARTAAVNTVITDYRR